MTMLQRSRRVSTIALSFLIPAPLGGCSGSNRQFSTICPGASIVSAVLSSPANGAVNVAPADLAVVLQNAYATETVTLMAPDGTSISGAPLVTVVPPAPTSGQSNGPGAFSSVIPVTLARATLYRVTVAGEPFIRGCGPVEMSGITTIGSFTTQ